MRILLLINGQFSHFLNVDGPQPETVSIKLGLNGWSLINFIIELLCPQKGWNDDRGRYRRRENKDPLETGPQGQEITGHHGIRLFH